MAKENDNIEPEDMPREQTAENAEILNDAADVSAEESEDAPSIGLVGTGAGGITSDDLNVITGSEDGEDNLRAVIADYFIEYASYVIKERAIPDVDDGMKPVQRRIMHVLDSIDDERFHKVNSVVGETMKYHPHGDASIKDALVVLANKEYFIEKQGNFGNILTGAEAAAGRYIECRLSPMAREVLFSHDVTLYADAYDGRNQEPVCLPSKIPTLLMLGSEGIAVGMNTKIMSHNFCELLEAQIAILENRPFKVLPDFPQGGLMDASQYDDGRGYVQLRAVIEPEGDKKVIIREIPADTTTAQVIASIEAMAKKGKLKISSITDYTAAGAEIEIALQRGVYAEEVIKELFAYTKCQVKIASNLLVIQDGHPQIMTVSQVLRRNTERLLVILKRELEIALADNEEKFQAKTLERIFIENRIYKLIEECDTMEAVREVVREGLEKFRAELIRDVTDDDISRLLQIPIRRISRYDFERNKEELAAIVKAMKGIKRNLKHLVEYTIDFIKKLLEKYGPFFPRRTKITSFDSINVRDIARKNCKVFLDRGTGFIGTGVKSSNKSDEPLICTEYDKIMILRNDGVCKVFPVSDKEYVGTVKYYCILDKEQVFSMLYRDKKQGTWYVKRFQIGQYINGKEYHTIPEGCVIERIYTNSGVVVNLALAPNARRSYSSVPVDFDTFPLRSREARGFKLTSYQVDSVDIVKRGTDAKSVVEAETLQNASQAESEAPQEPEIVPIAIPVVDIDEDDDLPEIPESVAAKEEPTTPVVEEKPEKAEPAKVAETEEHAAKKPAARPKKTPAASAAPKKDKPAAEPVSEPTKKPEPPRVASKQSESKRRLKISGKKIVDEDSPFFLE